MSNQLACYYSILRFCPYPETDEFVNVGVALACPTIGYLDFKRTRRRLGRVNDFFPELNPKIFSEALFCQEKALAEHRRIDRKDQYLADFDATRARDDFFTLVRPRETILYFSEPRVILSKDPSGTLDDLFRAYIERRFARTVEYQEGKMCDRLEKLLTNHSLIERFERNEFVGDIRFRTRFPFVRNDTGGSHAPKQAIKALYLDKEEATDIFRHADSWLNAVRRLRDFKTAPRELLFVLHPPKRDDGPHQEAFARVLQDYRKEGIPVTPESNPEPVLELARRD
jgi:hypothetical protein